METKSTHVLLDVDNVTFDLTDVDSMKKLLKEAAIKAGATVVFEYGQSFGEGLGISCVAVLSESHISVHTWPEHNFASFDIFTCGNCKPIDAAYVIVEALGSSDYKLRSIERGSRTELE